MIENSDAAQARVFAAMLSTEIKETTKRIEASERLVRTAAHTGDVRGRLWHNEEARSRRKVLYELHRQLDNLRNRFPTIDDAAYAS